jgi:pimeloyl-ACP methyl ester carboxylesterase
MRFCALMLCALAASTLDWSATAHSAPAPVAAAEADAQFDHISVKAIGSGDPVVLIPGLSTPRDVWDGIAPHLARSHRVILVQVNGFGGDEARANGKAGTLDGIVEDIHAYLAASKLGGARVIGHSMGGLVAMKLALAHPQSVDRLMVVDALPFFGTVIDDKASVESVRPMAETMRSRMLAAADAIGAKSKTAVTSDPGGDMSRTPENRIRIANWSMKADPAVVAEALYEDIVTDLRKDIATISTPMTILYHTGGDEAGINARIYARDYSAQPRAKLVPVANSAHFIMLDQPQRFESEVDEFLK